MQIRTRGVYRCFLTVALGVLFFVGWLSVGSFLIVRGIVPISLASLWTRSGDFIAAFLIGLLLYDCAKSLWMPLGCVGGYLLILTAIGFLSGGLNASEFWKVIVCALCGLLLCVFVKNKRVGKGQKTKKYVRRNRQKR